MAIKKQVRDEIVAKALGEISHARLHKRERIDDWHKNEDILVEKKKYADPTVVRSDVKLHKARGFINTILSKIDTPLSFKYLASHQGDYTAAKLANAMKEADSDREDWDFKDLLGKEQGVTYGRAIYYNIASSDPEYRNNLQNVDVYDFLIDPNAGGLDVDQARYCGHYGVVLDRGELEEGGKRGGKYITSEVAEILGGSGNHTEITQEESDKENRYLNFKSKSVNREDYDPDLFKFWNWYTTYKGERYYLVLSETHGKAIRVQKLSDITDSNMWPYWTWAAFPSLTEFWSYGFLDIAREIMMSQNIAINQMMDNAERIISPQRAIDVTSVVNESELRYRRNGIIRMKGGVDINSAFRVVDTPSISTPLDVYEVMEGILQNMSGVTGAIQGNAEEEKVGIYEGNLAAASDRFNLLNKSYANGYKRFAKLYLWGLKEHLTQATAVQIMGPRGVQIKNITNADIEPFEDFGIAVAASTAETESDRRAQKSKVEFLTKYFGSGIINDETAVEMEGELVGFDDSDMRRLKDKENMLNIESLSEAHQDIEAIINGKDIKPRFGADLTYFSAIFEYMKSHRENLTVDQFIDLSNYLNAVRGEVIENLGAQLNDELAAQGRLISSAQSDLEEGDIDQSGPDSVPLGDQIVEGSDLSPQDDQAFAEQAQLQQFPTNL